MKRIVKQSLLWLLISCLLLPYTVMAQAEEAENLLYNSDFSITGQGASLPQGWQFEAYADYDSVAGLYSDTEYGDCIGIESDARNDARVYQDVSVTPSATYEISAFIRTSGVSGYRGACLSVDNYSIDGTYCYSSDVTETKGWTKISMLVTVGPEQKTMRVALRLGGYGTTGKGNAWFVLPVCRQVVPEPGVACIDLMSDTGADGTYVYAEEDDIDIPGEEDDGTKVLLGILAVSMAVLLAGAILYWRAIRCEKACEKIQNADSACIFLLIFGFLLRLAASLVFYGHSTDIACFMAWGNAVLNGTGTFYTSGMFADYPPGYMYICGALSFIGRLLGLGYGTDAYVFLFKLPASVADLVSGYLLYRIASRRDIPKNFSLFLAGLIVLNPVTLFVSGGWGQVDSILALGLLSVILLLDKNKPVLAGIIYGLAILLKPQALMAGPLFAVFYFSDLIGPDRKKTAGRILLSVAGAVGVILLLALPFKGTQEPGWLLDKYFATASGYPYASVEAFNLPALLGGNWAPVETAVLGLSFGTWGTIFIAFAVVSASWMFLKGFGKNRTGAMFLSLSWMLACIFTFGHYMHERYLIPVLFLLLFAYVLYRDRRILIPFLLFTGSILLNSAGAMYIVDHRAARGELYNLLICTGSVLTTAGTVLLAYVSFSILIREKVLRAEEAAKKVYEERNMLLSLRERSIPGVTKKEKICLLAFTLAYAVIQLVNLGSLSAPQTVWHGEKAGESFAVNFGESVFVEEIWINGNIADGGMILFEADDASNRTYTQQYDTMFRWDRMSAGFETSGIRVSVYSGEVAINEIAFWGEEGTLLTPVSVDAVGTQLYAIDEQDTVPDAPSYYNGMYFDELYHARTAYEHLHGLSPYENSHPPLGKLIISIGIAIFGMNPFGWRISGAVFGILMLPVFYALSRRILRSVPMAFTGTALFAFDFMHFTQTRIATIDVFAVFFILVMYYCMFRYMDMDYFGKPYVRSLPWLGACGIAFGLGAASKWTCLYAGVGLAVLLFVTMGKRYTEAKSLKREGSTAEKKRGEAYSGEMLMTLLFCCGMFVIVPALIYYASYTPYFRYEAAGNADYGFKESINTVLRYQDFMYSYHSGLNATHPYQSAWYEWPFTVRPMWYYFSSDSGRISTMSASGNPAVWWVCTVAAAVLFLLRAGGYVKKDKGIFCIGVGILSNYLPWVLVSRCTFIYHFFATIPFILLASLFLLQMFEDRYPRLRCVKWIWLGAAVLFFVLLYPGISGYPVSRTWAVILRKLPGGSLMYGA